MLLEPIKVVDPGNLEPIVLLRKTSEIKETEWLGMKRNNVLNKWNNFDNTLKITKKRRFKRKNNKKNIVNLEEDKNNTTKSRLENFKSLKIPKTSKNGVKNLNKNLSNFQQKFSNHYLINDCQIVIFYFFIYNFKLYYVKSTSRYIFCYLIIFVYAIFWFYRF